jgi:hypothetical protein
MHNQEIKLLIGIPNYNQTLLSPLFASILNLTARLTKDGIIHNILPLSDPDIARLRNTFASILLHSDFTHILFVDMDMEFEANAILHALSLNKEIVGIGCPKKAIDWDYISLAAHLGVPSRHLAECGGKLAVAGVDAAAFCRDTTQAIDTAVPVPAMGTAIMLIARTAFEKVRAKFGAELEYMMPDLKYCPMYWDFFRPTIIDRIRHSEDHSWCLLAGKAGVQTYALTCYRVVHHGFHPYVLNRAAILDVEARLQSLTNQRQE